MNVDRLREWERQLRAVHEAQKPFNMAEWFEDVDKPHECGTAACAFGWATRNPVFIEQGLQVHRGLWFAFGDDSQLDPSNACRRFFDLTREQAMYITMPEEYDRSVDEDGEYIPTTAEMAADHIADVIAGRVHRDGSQV